MSPVGIQNSVTDKVLIGGGESDTLWLMDSMENLTALGPTPFSEVGVNGARTSVITVDPGTGYFIIHSATGELWEFDSEDDRWTMISPSTPLSDSEFNPNNIIGATCTTYNVSIYVRWDLASTPHMWLYKHSAAPPVKRPNPPSDLTAD
jgi:hypothetical protein